MTDRVIFVSSSIQASFPAHLFKGFKGAQRWMKMYSAMKDDMGWSTQPTNCKLTTPTGTAASNVKENDRGDEKNDSEG